MVSLIGLGGWSAANPAMLDESQSPRLIQRAVHEGITFMDNAWDYHDGMAEERMGKALADARLRDKVFLMTKCCGRTARDAQAGLEDSLRRLKTDRIDLWQFHEMCYDNDPDWIFAEDGAIHAGLKALKDGKVRYLGFTGHKHPQIHLDMIAKPFDWAASQMPLNVMDASYRSFQKQVLPSDAPEGHRRDRNEEPGGQRLDRDQGRGVGRAGAELRLLAAGRHAGLGDRLGGDP